MAKKSNKQKLGWSKKVYAYGGVAVLIVLIACIVGGCAMWRSHSKQSKTDKLITAELLVRADEGIMTPAPLDAQTGNIYFPQARLFVPMQDSYIQLTYAYSPGGVGGIPQLDVSSKSIFNASAAKLYTALANGDDIFTYVPKMQACQRGVHIVYNPLAEAGQPAYTTQLNNGKTAYMYIEKACPELNDVVHILKDIQAY